MAITREFPWQYQGICFGKTRDFYLTEYNYFRILNTCPDDLALILRAFGISIPYKLFTRGDLRSLKASATVF